MYQRIMSQVLEEVLWVSLHVQISVLLDLRLPLWEWVHLVIFHPSAKRQRVMLQGEEEVLGQMFILSNND